VLSQSEIARMPMRKGSDREGDIRVVSIGDWDRIGCGGTHVASAGRVGSIGLRRNEIRGGMTRVEFVCGTRALADYHMKTATVNAAGVALKARPENLYAQIERMLTQSDEQSRELGELRRRLLGYEAEELRANPVGMVDGRAIICQRLDGRDAESLRFLAQRLADGGAVALLGSIYEGKAQMVFACDKTAPCDLNAALKAVLPLVSGKGGGQKFMAQGGGPDVAGLDAALEAARTAILG